jgi:hypothetical protein
VQRVLKDLAPKGWQKLLEKHGLDISKSGSALASELERPLRIDRTVQGFEDFALGGYRAVEPGQLGRSLLYHALASSNVHPAVPDPDYYPTLEQLDTIENYIFSRRAAQLEHFVDPVIAVFAYQYRSRDQTTHRQHADVVFSRTGIARIGTEKAHYAMNLRCFDPRPAGDRGFRSLPARYGVFVAERRPQPPNGTVMRGVPLDATLTFLFPVHKLFRGDECLSVQEPNGNIRGITIPDIKYIEHHVNEKLAKVHLPQNGQNPGFVPPLSEPTFNLTQIPFVRNSNSDPTLVKMTGVGASVLLEPINGPLVRTATQSISGVDELVRLKVPAYAIIPTTPGSSRGNRYWSTLELPALGNSRAAPEYANIRQEVKKEQDGSFTLHDLNQVNAAEFDKKWDEGGYEAAHFLDNTCDGAITIEKLAGLTLPILCAYSLVTAVDYFPRVDQMEVEEWLEKRQGRSIGLAEIEKRFAQGGPQPMSDGRFEWRLAKGELAATRQLPNCTLPHPSDLSKKAFSLADSSNYTISAVVSNLPAGGSISAPSGGNRPVSWLPDAASDVFAPGWDVSQHQLDNQNMYVAYGLGSPFPEDAKLCAALNSFWPAVAPDSARTYGYRPRHPITGKIRLLTTSLPLSDLELGYHPSHPRVAAGEVRSHRGWDGDYGPFVVLQGGHQYVDASNPLRADQTRAALDHRLWFSGLDLVSTPEFIQRLEAIAWCREKIEMNNFEVLRSWLVTFEAVPDWATWTSAIFPKANSSLTGRGMIFVFADAEPGADHGDPPLRRRYPIKNTLEVHLANLQDFSNAALLLDDSAAPIVFARLNSDPFKVP